MKILAATMFDFFDYAPRYQDVSFMDPEVMSGASVKLDVTGALTLEGGNQAATGIEGVGAGLMSAAGSHPQMVWVMVFTVTLLALYRYRARQKEGGPIVSAVMASLALPFILAGVLALGAICGYKARAVSADPVKYARPEDATRAILHGIISDAVYNTRSEITSLADVKDEVGLPTNKLTKGQAHAIANYHLDGWGRAFDFKKSGDKKKPAYTITSKGADGKAGTPDDVSMDVTPASGLKEWERGKRAFFIRKINGEHLVFFHRYSGKDFKFKHGFEASKYTGGALFDMFTEYEMNKERKDAVTSLFERLSAGSRGGPIILYAAKFPDEEAHGLKFYRTLRLEKSSYSRPYRLREREDPQPNTLP